MLRPSLPELQIVQQQAHLQPVAIHEAQRWGKQQHSNGCCRQRQQQLQRSSCR